MLEQFVSALPGSFAPIVLTVVVGAVCKPDDERYHRTSRLWRIGGVVIGLIGAIVFAALRATGELTQRTIVNVPTLIACLICDGALVVLFAVAAWKNGQNRDDRATQDTRRGVQIDVRNAVFAVALAVTYFRAFPDVILRVTSFVQAGESFFTSDMLMRALGFALGIGTSVVIAAIFSTMTSSVSSRIFAVTGIALVLLIAAQHIIDITQILYSTGVIILFPATFALLAWGLNHTLTIVIAQAAVFIIPVIASIIVGWKTALVGENLAIVRSRRAMKRRSYVTAVFGLVSMLAMGYALTYGVAATHEEIAELKAESYSVKNGFAHIKLSQVSDGHLHRFEYTAKDGTKMSFLAIKKGGGSVVVVLDACENCGDAGYYEKDGKVICKKCDVAMNVATIGFKGGCNPIPLDFTNNGKTVSVRTADLDAQSQVFRR
ncbi:Fe-S-containing protein [Alloscardovia venturai]|uniref:Fe-S-containing protein n=1 Tax=Alloscardovia venturai TaxID=1769421 RepID=A0ABW2Y553_9BIFI